MSRSLQSGTQSQMMPSCIFVSLAAYRRNQNRSTLACCENAREPLLQARSWVVHAAVSAGFAAPWLDLDDPDGMETAARQAKVLGFSGKGAVHPNVIAALNTVSTLTKADIEPVRHTIDTFEQADTGLVVIDGKLIEKPVLRVMYRILAIAERVATWWLAQGHAVFSPACTNPFILNLLRDVERSGLSL